MPELPSNSEAPSFADLRALALECFGKRPCLWQMKVAKAFVQKDRDIVCIAGTSLGKTMSFWLPLLLKKGLQIIVTPLNQLGKQNVDSLAKAGMQSISISAETASWSNFRDIEDMKYLVVIVSPEQLMKPGGEFEKLLHKPEFASQIIRFIFDEAHCITSWGEFRPEYKELQRLRYILPCYVPFMMASATLAPSDLSHAKRLLRMRAENLVTVKTSIDRFNIKLCVRKIKHSLASFQDLAFLIPDGWKNNDPIPPKFLVFFDSIQDAIAAAKSLQKRLPVEMRDKIKWFNSDMTTEYKENEVRRLTSGETWGLCTTESFGMGMDIPDIMLVIQWRATCKLSTLWQRWGRAARDRLLQGTAVLFAEKEYFDDVHQERRQRQETRKRKADDKSSAPAAMIQSRNKRQHVAKQVIAPTEEVEDENVQVEDERMDGNERGNNAGEGDRDSELRDMLTSTAEGKTRWNARKKRKELDPPMDCLINAHLRDTIQCRRRVFCVHFDETSAAPDHFACDPSLPQGCLRCAPVPPETCCDIHHPNAFLFFDAIVPTLPKAPQRSRLPKHTTMGPAGFDLCGSLEDWREAVTRRVYGDSNLCDYGPSLVMPDSVLDRIVDCAQHTKIVTIQDLRKETRWSGSDEFGGDIITIIHRLFPVPASAPVLTLAPLQHQSSSVSVNNSANNNSANNSANNNATPPSNPLQSTARKASRCSACNIEGHNSRFLLF
ncbi:P-loop containing nucleoside triphosphate hydrolase protein [Suillus clintonianus]|uniref:P-loop containing nucleoside triphosphate hydrolase protein n=1 Tax=Suillus clintonianus TaxID=1904413 RepID=UPI001B86803B|nr:P-loop containing nucleoside triphosphate hydrolase protein [Suillus clintonianus]KAG2148115.1 P-loop containing nucleoside triphosphate hydrolase protein [Suillus clintonianus]